jgi:hypothetical protein
MPREQAIDQFFFQILRQYDSHVRAPNAYNRQAHYPVPNLMNNVMPIFTERWATGPGQHTREIYHFLEPALKLASRLLTEKFPLMWFSHLTFGERRHSRSGTHIVPTTYSTSADAIAKVKDNIRTVGELVTFMFQPPGHHEGGYYGITSHSKHEWPFSREFKNHWPPTRRPVRKGYARPLIVISNMFQDYFRRHVSTSSQDEHYRVLLLLATTMVHEFAHAYEFWLTPDEHEPCWSKSEKDPELGWSWEGTVLGYGLNHLSSSGRPGIRNNFLYQFKVLEYKSPSERQRVLDRLAGSNRTDAAFTPADARGRIATPPIIDANDFRYSEFFLDDDTNVSNYVAAAQVVPMDWVVAWFREEEWQRRVEFWQRSNMYVRPSLGNAFIVLYERSVHRAGTLRPLYPAFPVDKEILDRRARGDLSR